jgi:truncated hemoglobin YjbI
MKTELEFLFQEIGSEAKLFSLLHEFYQRLSQDLMIGFFFANKDLVLISQKQAEFMLRAMGARPSYSGKAPAEAHRALPPLLAGHFDRRVHLLKGFLEEKGLSNRSVQAWIQFEEAFRPMIVQKN